MTPTTGTVPRESINCDKMVAEFNIIIIKLHSWKESYGSLNPALAKETQCRIKLPVLPLSYPAILAITTRLVAP